MKKLGIVFVLVFLLVACGGKQDSQRLTIIDGDNAEMNLATHMAKILIEEHTDYEVEIRDFIAYPLAFKETKEGKNDILATYDGSLLSTYLQIDPSNVPEGESVYAYANEMANEANVKLLEKMSHQNTYAVAVKKETADQYNLKTISDLRDYEKELKFSAEHAFFEEEGTVRFNAFTKFYDLDFKAFNSIDLGLKYTAIDSNNMDVTMVFESDGLNKKYGLSILEDDMKFFPEYYMAYLLNDSVESEFPGVEAALNKLAGKTNINNMIELNYRIDVNEEKPAEVARDFLLSEGLIK